MNIKIMNHLLFTINILNNTFEAVNNRLVVTLITCANIDRILVKATNFFTTLQSVFNFLMGVSCF